ncbi:MAG: hypothetical protein HY862_18925 [Chloroflexi bacterium]|nr:hypothetical protein [Chloroflexota bacterium]
MTGVHSNHSAAYEVLAQGFIEAIESYDRGEINSRGLVLLAQQISTPEVVDQMGDELLSHAFWAMRHLVHRPACWAPTPAEVRYLLRCLRGEEVFSLEVAESFRQ